MDSVSDDSITHKVYDRYRERIGRANHSIISSWTDSLKEMSTVLDSPLIPANASVAIEFVIPLTSNRVDFILTGFDAKKQGRAIIVELKRWTYAEKVEDKDGIVRTWYNRGLHETTHPSYQACSYYHLIEEYNQTIRDDNVTLHPCTYLHNFEKKDSVDLLDPIYLEYLKRAPPYFKGDTKILRDFIEAYIKDGDDKIVLFKLDNGRIKPSKSLHDVLGRMLAGNKEFFLVDSQKVAYENALSLAKKSKADDKKRVIIVEGGPGTGKSVIAVNLLVNLIGQKLFSVYVSKNAAPRNVYSTKLRGKYKQDYISSLFKGSGYFYNTPKKMFDALIVDEAHRLNEKSGLYRNLGENQIKEIIYSSKFSIFFIDENQKIDILDIGSKEEIEKQAKLLGAEVICEKLESQFRCNGSDGYLSWIDDVLGIKNTANFDGFDLNYDIQIIDDPNAVRKIIEEKNKSDNKSRVVAGYCWDWVTAGKNNPNFFDINMEDENFHMSWNLGNTQTWAIDPESVKEAGCIHTCQGLEFDYVGVIIGPDMRFENGKIVTDFEKRAITDQSLRGIKNIAKNDLPKAKKIADEIIKNTYRTLMTRGQKGCYVYCCDKNLGNYLKQRIAQIKVRKQDIPLQ